MKETDVVNIRDFRKKADTREADAEAAYGLFEELTAGFSDHAVGYLATEHPELWKDAGVRAAALTIVTGFMCKDACSFFLHVAKTKTSSPDEFRRLCRRLTSKKRLRD